MPPLLGEREKNIEDVKISQNARVITSESLAKNKQKRTRNLRRRLQNLDMYTSEKKRLPTNRKEKPHRRLVEEHYKIDKTNGLLPGVPKYDTDLSGDIHDFFNLIVLVPIVLLNVLNWDWDMLGRKDIFLKRGIALRDCWTGEYFDLFFSITVAYFLIDLVWVCVIPKCVKSPTRIVQHHIATLAILYIPYRFHSFQFLFGVDMMVEVNTWFLIARRATNKNGLPPWKLGLPHLFSVKVKLISIFFYVTWITIRCVLYPYVLVIFYSLLKTESLTPQEEVALTIAAFLQAIFCVLNATWTIDLIKSKIKQQRSKQKTLVLQSGL